MSVLVKIGLIELAFGGLLGWPVALYTYVDPHALRRFGVAVPRRVFQAHLDFIMMGLILIGIGLALPALPGWLLVPLIAGTWLNPALLLLLAFSDDLLQAPAYRVLGVLSFAATSGSLVAVAIAA
nr:hypothetical protein [Kibdelosporangium sp. MJ126-NF4]CEL13965.1 hypothetical protein [Kibdelosporangium sp. MJ126-NF4]CTQ88334.1 hypothetical protein [Kibdelosporangium sp. MJ126-NF4]